MKSKIYVKNHYENMEGSLNILRLIMEVRLKHHNENKRDLFSKHSKVAREFGIQFYVTTVFHERHSLSPSITFNPNYVFINWLRAHHELYVSTMQLLSPRNV